MSMTWNQLRAHIDMMDKEQLHGDATIHLMPIDEYFAVADISFSPEDDVLDKGHPFLIVNTTGLVKDSYEGGVCPDCQEEIPDDCPNGGECSNCGHVFYGQKESL